MEPWDIYQMRIETAGRTMREAALKREQRYILNKLPNNLSYTTATIFDDRIGYNITEDMYQSGDFDRQVAIINSDNLNEKTIISMPGEDIGHGSLVYWMGNHWLVTERDANTTVYTRAKMTQCNFLLKWVSEDNEIIEQWCIIEDGTKYLTGEMEDRHFIVTRGDSRIAMTLARNDETKRLGRTNRFLIDDYESPTMIAYQLTKPLKLGWTFNEHGVYKFVLQEVQTTNNDNVDLRIADYYKHFNEDGSVKDKPRIDGDSQGREGWI